MKSIDKKEVVIWLMTLVIVLIICCLLSLCGGNSSERCTGDKTKCERTKCECEASVTANQRVTKHKQHERQKTKCAQNIHGANNSAYITTGGMGVFLTRAAFSVSHGCNGMNRGKNA